MLYCKTCNKIVLNKRNKNFCSKSCMKAYNKKNGTVVITGFSIKESDKQLLVKEAIKRNISFSELIRECINLKYPLEYVYNYNNNQFKKIQKETKMQIITPILKSIENKE